MTENTVMRTEKTLYMNNAIPSRLCDFGMVGRKPLETDMLKIWKQKIDSIEAIIKKTSFGEYSRLVSLFSSKDKLEAAYCRILERRIGDKS